jgi:tetratricopeptide (TPR) repeat protein
VTSLGALVVIAVVQAATVDASRTPPSDEARAAFEKGRRLYETGQDMKGAKDDLDDAIRLDPDYTEAYLYRALVVYETGGVKASRSDFEFALKLSPNYKEAHRYFAEALAEGGEIPAAEQHYRAALAIDPEYPDAMYLLAKLERDKGDLKTAIELLNHHVKVEPKGSGHMILGEIYLEQGENDKAIDEFRQDLEIDPTEYETRLNLAGLLLDQDSYDDARKQYEESLLYHPADGRALKGLGRAYLKLGDYELAVGTLRNANDLSPDDVEVKADLKSARDKLRAQYGAKRWQWIALAGGLGLLLGFGGPLLARRMS